jgi:hypothetical protein
LFACRWAVFSPSLAAVIDVLPLVMAARDPFVRML